MIRPLFRLMAWFALAVPLVPLAAQEAPPRQLDGAALMDVEAPLPADAAIVIAAQGLRGAMLAGARIEVGGQPGPIPFSFQVPAGPGLRLTVAIEAGGAIAWMAPPIAVLPGSGTVDLGVIDLPVYVPLTSVSTWDCGGTGVVLGQAGETWVIDTGDGRIPLQQVEAASGATYAAADGSDTVFREHGGEAQFTLAGAEMPPCRIAAPPVYRAAGSAPDWEFTATGSAAARSYTLSRAGAEDLSGPLPAPQWAGDAVVWALPAGGPTVRMRDTLCHDAAGVPHPETVAIVTGDAMLSGCGGAPDDLLAGADWTVTDPAGGGPDTAPTLQFGPRGGLSGLGGCNRFQGSHARDGAALVLTVGGVTRMACPPPVMAAEARFLALLPQVTGFDIDADATLVLSGAGGEALITARRD